jgi:hypothetical protein
LALDEKVILNQLRSPHNADVCASVRIADENDLGLPIEPDKIPGGLYRADSVSQGGGQIG